MINFFKRASAITILTALTLFILGAVSGCGTSTTSAPDTGTGSSGEPIQVDAVAMVKEFEVDGSAAKAKYNNKVIQGKFFVVTVANIADIYNVNLKASNDPYYTGAGTFCFTTKEDASTLTKDQQVTVRGTVDTVDYTLGGASHTGFQLKNCSVVK